ncbi:hypothetical protein [Kitasatospora sp. NPDC093558]|uniref:hypothetical protein n=1 Tax=Kitasatospora sp. NPDC093558 TaxID=3155201 RepID=UPI00343BA3D1
MSRGRPGWWTWITRAAGGGHGRADGVGGSWAALTRLVGPTPAVVPWEAMGTLAAACAAIALTAAVLPAALALRGRDGEDILRGAA